MTQAPGDCLEPHFGDVQAHYDLSDDFFRLFLDPRVLLCGWEQFDEPVDRILSIGAFEHFGQDRYDDFFAKAHDELPDCGIMLLHTITSLTMKQALGRGVPLTMELARFVRFLMTEIFPGGQLPTIEMVEERSTKAGFTVTRTQSLQRHCARTLDTWAQSLQLRKDPEG